MRKVTVYRMDYGRRTKSPIGVVTEKSKNGTDEQLQRPAAAARRLFANDTADSSNIVIDMSQAPEGITSRSRTRDISRGSF